MGSILSLVGKRKSHAWSWATHLTKKLKEKKELKMWTKIKLQIGKLERWKGKLEGGGGKGGKVGEKGEEMDGGGRGRKEEGREKKTP